jgi:hypothetical protein
MVERHATANREPEIRTYGLRLRLPVDRLRSLPVGEFVAPCTGTGNDTRLRGGFVPSARRKFKATVLLTMLKESPRRTSKYAAERRTPLPVDAHGEVG